MKLVSFRQQNIAKPGLFTKKGIIDITLNWPDSNPPRSVKQILIRGDKCLETLALIEKNCDNFLNENSVKLLAPIPNPPKILALAGNYTKHIIEAGLKLGLSDSPAKTTVPRPFIMPGSVINHPESTIPWPTYSKDIDYEIELAIIIGKTAKNITPSETLDYIAGYTVANDISARSVTFKQARAERPWDEFYDWLNGKWADGFLPIGPCIVTKDEIPDVQNLELTLKVNGQVRQNANTFSMIHSVAEIVSFISNLMTLQPGDIIATGTPEGVGMADGRFLEPGDNIECEIEKIGTLKNSLSQRPENFYQPLKAH